MAAYPKAEGFLEPPAGRGPTELPTPRQDSASESTEGPGTRIGRYERFRAHPNGSAHIVMRITEPATVARLAHCAIHANVGMLVWAAGRSLRA